MWSSNENISAHDFLIPLSISDQYVLSGSPFQFANGLRQSGTTEHSLKIQSTYLSAQADWPSGWSAGFVLKVTAMDTVTIMKRKGPRADEIVVTCCNQ